MRRMGYCALALLAVSTAQADTITGGTGSLQAFPGSLTPVNGSPYWNNLSTDLGGFANIGYFLTGTGGFAGNPNSPGLSGSDLSFFGTGSGGSVSDMSFISVASAVNITIVALNTGANIASFEVGLIDINNGNSLIPLFTAGNVLLGNSSVLVPPGEYGLYLIRNGEGELYATDTALNQSAETNPTAHQHFAIFGNSLLDTYFVGIEDWHVSSESVGDFQDVILRISQEGGGGGQEVPEPSVMSTLGLGLAAIGAAGYRRRRLRN